MEQENEKKDTLRKEGKDIVWAVFLIFIGAVFLLNTTGLVDWNIWTYIFRFWPIFLILAGVKLIIGKSIVAEIILSVVSVILFVAIGVLSYLFVTAKEVSFLPSVVNRCILDDCNSAIDKTDLVEQVAIIKQEDYSNVESRNIDLSIGAAEFNFEDEESTNYLEVNSKFSKGYYDPSIQSKLEDGNLDIEFKTVTKPMFGFVTGRIAEFVFTAGQQLIPTDLDIDLGAGEGTLVLDTLKIQKVTAQVGAGSLSMDFSNRAIPSEEINVKVGAGEIELNFPEYVGYEISYDLGIGEISNNGEEIATFAGNAKNVRSSNYDSASQIVKIVADVGVGSLVINNK